MKIQDYTILSTIYNDRRTVVYKAMDSDGDIVAIKSVVDSNDQDYSNKLYHEYEITQELSGDFISRTICLIEEEKPYLVKSFEEGKTLSILIPRGGLTLDLFASYSISIIQALEYVHQNNIIHLDLKPENILCDEVQKSVKLLDFGESLSNINLNKSLKRNIQTIGTASYLAPEQTGLSNQTLDERSDLYSLGIIFYEMLTGKLPFEGEETLQILHSHLAQIPKEIHSIKPSIPITLSNIVQKLLSKDKQERYQSAASLKYDLKNHLKDPSARLHLGSQEISDKLVFTQKLYGRDHELDLVKNKLNSIVASKPKLLMISGYSGVGKSSFINELSPIVLAKNGTFVKGKFDQYNHTSSYVAFIPIFISLINQFNCLMPEIKQTKIDELSEFLGESKNALIKIVPELKAIFNVSYTPISDLLQLKNQMFIAIERFFGFFALKDHPLVIFLDDLQWADIASLEILELIYSSNKLESFLIIGAYRSNEVSSSHPLKLSLNNIAKRIGKIEEFELFPLKIDAINELLRDMLHKEDVDDLGYLLIQKTEGNPFFLKQFIYTLLKRELLSFNKEIQVWEWKIETIRHQELTNNVIDHLIDKIVAMSVDAQNFIKIASVIGDSFDIDSILHVSQCSQNKMLQIIDEIMLEGLIERSSEDKSMSLGTLWSCHFVHDKIRQTAYTMLTTEEKKQTHLKVFRSYLDQEQVPKTILSAAKHIIEVIDLIEEKEIKSVLETLNMASNFAKEALAYQEAIQHAKAAVSLLHENAWSHNYEITCSIYLCLLESFCQAHIYEEALSLFEQLLHNNLLQKIDIAKVYNLRLLYHFAQGLIAESLEDGRMALQVLEQEIPNDSAELLDLKNNEIEWLNANIKSVEELQYLNIMQNENIELCMNILVNMGIPAFVSRQDMFSVVTLKMVHLSFLYGNCNVSPYGYMLSGMIVGAGLEQYENGYRYGQVAIALQDKFANKSIECKLLRIYGAYVASWIQPHEQTLSILYKAYMSGIENGDFTYASYCVNHIFTREFLLSTPLDILEEKTSSYLDFLIDLNEPSILGVQYLFINVIKCLRGNTLGLNSLSLPEFDEQKVVENFTKINYKTMLAYYYIYKLQICYIHEYYDEAVEHAQKAKEYLPNIKGNILESEWVFYYALSLFKRTTDSMQQTDIDLLQEFEHRFKLWSELCPENFLAKYLIIKGLNAYSRSSFDAAFDNFEKALHLQDEGFTTIFKALTLELIGICWKSKNNWRIAKMYLQEAYNIFYNLKAIGKTKLLFNTQSELLHREAQIQVNPTMVTQNTGDLNIFDEDTILKATELISGKIDRSELIKKFTSIIAQSFGIQIGGIILKENNIFFLEGLFNINSDPKIIIEHQSLNTSNVIPKSVIKQTLSDNKVLIIDDAINDSRFTMDQIIIERKIASVICAPIFLKETLIGLIYMENNFIRGFFDNTREKVLNILLTQTAATLELEHLYSHDKLTGCYSRQKLDEVLLKNDFSALLLININNLDFVNSTYGYTIGDEILKLFVSFLHNFLIDRNTLFRLSSDEFVILIDQNSSQDKEILAIEIIKALQNHKFEIENYSIILSCTIGITSKSDENFTETPLVRAHAAMKEARQSGANKFMTYSADSVFLQKQRANLEWMLKVKDALTNDAILPFFQPILNNETNKIVKYEALARLIENGNVISPFHFIEPARLVGLLPKITQIILMKSFKYFQNKPYDFTVNISEEDLKARYLLTLLTNLSKKYNIAPHRVTLEILENISAQENEAAIEQLLELKSHGFKIALDDFGSEKSNFFRLQKMNVDYIKIDGSFIKDIHTNKNNLNICKTIVHLAQALGCEVIAEFVHSAEVLDVVQKIGIKYSQGYYISEPKQEI